LQLMRGVRQTWEPESGVKRTRFLKMVQHRAARVAVTASATRGQGKGVVDCARGFLAALTLGRFGTDDERGFVRQLDMATKDLHACLPKRAASWGLARKLLNIFLRDSLYTSYLAKAHGLAAAERLLEIPLDSITSKRIRREVPALPRWPGWSRSRTNSRVTVAAARCGWPRV